LRSSASVIGLPTTSVVGLRRRLRSVAAVMLSRASLLVLSARKPAASIVYTLTFARLAVSISERNRARTLAGIASPSEKKITDLRPGSARMLLTTASSALLVEYPC
jgi:hypothetical protein